MTVAELIRDLQQLPQDAQVLLSETETDGYGSHTSYEEVCDVSEVTLRNTGDYLVDYGLQYNWTTGECEADGIVTAVVIR